MGPGDRSSPASCVAVGCLAVHDMFDPAAWRAGPEGAWAAAFWDLLLFVPPLVGGWVSGVRRADRLAEQNAALEQQRAEETRAAVSDERARIARELHDSVTHNMNIVVLQAMAAAGVLDEDPSRVREPLKAIERSAPGGASGDAPHAWRPPGGRRRRGGDRSTVRRAGSHRTRSTVPADSGLVVDLAVEGDRAGCRPRWG